jgi:tetratricopeptide (TPR) repeat protein
MKRSVCFFCFVLAAAVFSPLGAAPVPRPADDVALVQGYESYRRADWTSAMMFLRRAVMTPSNSTVDTWYMLIMSEMYAGEYKTAEADCEQFLKTYSGSSYAANILYQKGRALHLLGQNDQAVLSLSDFCHAYGDNELYPSALYWIAESFYAEYNYDSARALYERIVSDFPGDAKAPDAQYRIETIDQRSREEKLLYLLKVTGEEYLASKEEYERQLRQYKTEDLVGVRRQLSEAQARIADLEARLNAAPAPQSAPVSDPEVDALKAKAKTLQTLLDENESGVTQ